VPHHLDLITTDLVPDLAPSLVTVDHVQDPAPSLGHIAINIDHRLPISRKRRIAAAEEVTAEAEAEDGIIATDTITKFGTKSPTIFSVRKIVLIYSTFMIGLHM
jgi:hypothetical protein